MSLDDIEAKMKAAEKPQGGLIAMPFQYSEKAHMRKHGPSGYLTYETYKDWLRDEFSFRCVLLAWSGSGGIRAATQALAWIT